MSEKIDVFDANYNRIGSMDRMAVHKQGLWHHTFHCWIVREGNRTDDDVLLFQLRSAKKKNYPNMLDITGAGHLLSGETPLDGIREVEEELGLELTEENDLKYLGIKHDIMDESNGVRNREFAHVYIAREKRNLFQYRLQASEVSGLVEVPINLGIALFSQKLDVISSCRAVRLNSDDEPEELSWQFSRDDVIPRVDNYYLKTFLLARAYLDGATELAI